MPSCQATVCSQAPCSSPPPNLCSAPTPALGVAFEMCRACCPSSARLSLAEAVPWGNGYPHHAHLQSCQEDGYTQLVKL